MKDPLQEKDALYSKLRKSRLIEESVESLVQLFMFVANEGAESSHENTKAWSKLARRWLRRLHQHGISDGLLRDVNLELSPLRFKKKLERTLHGSVVTLGVEMTNVDEVSFSAKIANLFAVLLEKIDVTKIKQCERYGCNNYYFGGDRAKWCSNKCGTYVRVNHKRKLDKERQML